MEGSRVGREVMEGGGGMDSVSLVSIVGWYRIGGFSRLVREGSIQLIVRSQSGGWLNRECMLAAEEVSGWVLDDGRADESRGEREL